MSHRVDPTFRAALDREFAGSDLEAHPSTIFGLAPDFRLAYVNPAWHAFAEANAGQPAIGRDWPLGACYFDAIPEPLLPFYRALFERAAAVDAAPHPITHAYECSSAAIQRFFVMQIFSLPGAAGFLVVNSLRNDGPALHPEHMPILSQYAGADGLVRQCAHCRRIQSANDEARWDWVSAWVERPLLTTSHALCGICFLHYYPNGMMR